MKLLKDTFQPLLKLAIPLMLTGFLQSSVAFFETIFLAHLGPDTLAAGALISWLFGTLIVILYGVLASINILVAHKHGAQDEQGILHVVRDGFWLAILFAIPLMILFWYGSSLFLLLGQSQSVVLLADAYLHAITWGIVPTLIMIAILEVIVGLGQARLILLFTILSVLLTIFFSFALIFGKFGLPALGIAGAGWGMTIGSWITTFLLSIYVLINKNYRRYFYLLLTPTKPFCLLELVQIGAPMGIMYCVEVAFFFALTLIMGSFGNLVMAANQIALQYMGLMTIIFSIAQAITVRMGHLLGAGDTDSAERAAYAGVTVSGLLMLLMGLIFWLYPLRLIAIDFDVYQPENAKLVHFAVQFLMVSALFQIVEGIRISLYGTLRALKDTQFTLLISIISFWGIALPIGYCLATRLNFGGQGLWWGMVFGASCSVILLFWRFKFKIKAYHHEST